MTKFQRAEQYSILFLKASIGVLLVVALVKNEWFLAFSSLFYLSVSFIPVWVSRSFKVRLPVEVDFIFALIIYLHFFLGEYSGFYKNLWWWDLFLHTADSAILGIAGFAFAYTLTLAKQIKGKPIFISLYSISFAVMIGVIWEIIEFGMDRFFGTHAQGGGLVDTMGDLIADVIGASFMGIVGYFYIRDGKDGIFSRIIDRVTDIKVDS